MSKPRFVISCPFDTYSGYGARSRDIVKAIIELDKYEVQLLPQNGVIHHGDFVATIKMEIFIKSCSSTKLEPNKTRYLDANNYS